MAVLLGSVALLLAPPAAQAGSRASEDMFDARYCEILEVRGESPDLVVNVWNTFGLNGCPQRAWDAIDAPALADDLGAFAVVLNGPRHFVMDRARATPAGGVRSFRGIRMRHLATIDVGDIAGLAPLPFVERTINRRNTFIWNRGRRIYELIAPSGRRYVMQSYSLQGGTNLTVRKLAGLGRRLKLPAGWRFRTRRLTRALDLTVTRRATVVRDDMGNTYQRVR